jgi:hypothetical protein
VSKALLDSALEPLRLHAPADLPLSTVSEITGWLVGHRINTVERELILNTLDHCSGNRVWAASILGISPRALEQKLRGYARQGIAVPEPRDEADVEELRDDPDLEAEDLRQDNHVQGRRDPRWIIAALCASAAVVFISFSGFRMLSRVEQPANKLISGREISALTETPPVSASDLSARSEPAAPREVATHRIAIDSEAMPVMRRNLPHMARTAAPSGSLAAPPIDIEQDARMDVTIDIEQDTRMDIAVDIEQDTRMESAASASPAGNSATSEGEAAPQTKASFDPLDTGQPLVFDEPIPLPPRRPPPRPVVQPRSAQPAPSTSATEAPSLPLLFPFNIFSKGNAGTPDGGSQPTR